MRGQGKIFDKVLGTHTDFGIQWQETQSDSAIE